MNQSINVYSSEGEFRITKDNFEDSISRIDDLLEPGVPVLFSNYTQQFPGHGKSVSRYLFHSDGALGSDGVFSIELGERRYSYASVGSNPLSYYIVSGFPHLHSEKLTIPDSWVSTAHNEGTFSPSGGVSWGVIDGSGTEAIYIGETVSSNFSDAFRSVSFARDSALLDLPSFYSSLDSCVTRKLEGTREEKRRLEDEMPRDLNKAVNLQASINLLKSSLNIVEENYDNNLKATEVGYFRNAVENFGEIFPVSKDDFLVQEISHPGRSIAFVKLISGKAYILPYSNDLNRVVDFAFNPMHVSHYFPGSSNVISLDDILVK